MNIFELAIAALALDLILLSLAVISYVRNHGYEKYHRANQEDARKRFHDS